MAWGIKPQKREAKFIEALNKLEKGKTYLFVEHPAVGGDEMKGIFHIGYENVSEDRQSVLNLFTSPRVKALIKEKGIELVSYGQLIKKANSKKYCFKWIRIKKKSALFRFFYIALYRSLVCCFLEDGYYRQNINC